MARPKSSGPASCGIEIPEKIFPRKKCSPGRNQHGWIKGHIFLYMSAGGKAPNLSFIFPASPTSDDKADERG